MSSLRFGPIIALLLGSSTALLRAEPIRLHPANPHYFLFQGKAVALVTSGEHYGAVLNADVDYRKYLATLEADGLNYTRLFGGSYVEAPGKSFGILRNDLAPLPGRFVAPWMSRDGKLDLNTWNPEFFRRYHEFLGEAARRGIVVEVTLFSSQYGEAQWSLSPFNPANNVNRIDAIDWKKVNTLENGQILGFQERYTRKLVHEANEFDNVIFEIQNEPWSDRPVLADVVNPYLFPPARDQYPNSIDVADALSLAWQARVAEWITSEESSLPRKHLLAQNYSNFVAPIRQLVPHVSLVNFHYAYPQAATVNYGFGLAIGYDETGFLGQDDRAYLRQAWNFLLAGGSTFDSLDYSFTPGHEDGADTEKNGPGGGSPTFRHQLRILVEFLRTLPLVSLAPDTTTVKHAGGTFPHVLSNTDGVYAMYLDGSGPVDLRLELPHGDYAGEWLDVRTGEKVPVARFTLGGGEKVLHSPAFENGIALRLTAAAR